MLKELDLKAVYNSGDDNLVKDFFVPSLSSANEYCRSVGYFSAQVLYYVSEGLTGLIENRGKMRLIVGTQIEEGDEKAILDGYDARDILQNKLNNEIDNWSKEIPKDHYFWERLSSLSWLIENNFLDIKVAIKRSGIYHEKIGIITDGVGDKIVFQGSANETVAGIHPAYNFESLDVYKSWNTAFEEHIEIHTNKFERLWKGTHNHNGLLVLDFPIASKERLLKKRIKTTLMSSSMEVDSWNEIVKRNQENKEKEDIPSKSAKPRVPDQVGDNQFSMRPHQKEALEKWRDSSFQGILELCTGSGKTITAIYGLVKILQQSRSKRLFVVIAVPFINLADQWCDELGIFNIKPIRCYDSQSLWLSKLESSVRRFNGGSEDFVCTVVVNKTLRGEVFREFIGKVEDSSSFLWIGDECHNHESKGIFDALPENADLRLGLSATIENCKRISEYYGESVMQYSLENAISDGFLTPYEYFPHVVSLDEEESEKYISLTQKIAPMEAARQNGSSFDDKYLNLLYGKRADLLGNVKNKLIYLKSLLSKLDKPIKNTLFYCSSTQGALELGEDSNIGIEDLRQIDAVTTLLWESDWKISRYTSREGRNERKSIMKNFKDGSTHALVAIRCLDEGVDIPAVDTAFILASSSSSKQYIQRRGRVLRKSPGKDKARVHDFVVILPNENLEYASYHKSLLKKELRRVMQFSAGSLNPDFSKDTLSDMCEEAGIEIDFFEGELSN